MSSINNQDDCYDDWEAAEDAGLEPLPIQGLSTEHARNQQLWEEANRGEHVIVVHNNPDRTQYVPERKILQRPKETIDKRANKQAAASPSIDERQKSYEAARRRIFGDDTSTCSNKGQESPEKHTIPTKPSKVSTTPNHVTIKK
ncbi:hypothetical protein BDF19DRAFT_449730 [Syncephalis fuscata]|nr:hypothetical protein BDF19DRAFT_449730 [Syncephalis fuscata]